MTEPSSTPVPPRAALRYPDFRLYLATRFFSNVAHLIQVVAIGWQVYDLTHDPLDLGYVGLSVFLPQIAFVLFTGAVADRFDRRWVALSFLVLETFSTVALLWMTIAGLSSVLPIFAVLVGGATALLPIYARDILMVGPWGLGLLRSAPALGATVCALTLTRRPLKRRAGLTMFFCVACYGLATIVFGLSTNFFLSLGVLVIMGACDMISVFVRQNLVQLGTPDAMRGRVSAVNLVFIGASNELGEFESGVTASWFGTVPAVVIGGIGTLAVVGLWAWRFRELRRIDKLEDAHTA